MLELSHIDKYYNPGSVNEMCLFQDFNLTIPDSQFVSVVGSNGSGKTSMLNLICGSISADAGKVIVNGTDILDMDLVLLLSLFCLLPLFILSHTPRFGLFQ